MSAVEEIRLKLQQRLTETEREIDSLRTALRALDAQAAPSPRPRRQPVPAPDGNGGRRRPGVRRSSEPRSAELERLLAETGGISAVELAKQTGTDPGEVLARIRELERAGRVNGDA